MRYNKTFTKEEFLDLPVFASKEEAPKDRSPFLMSQEQLQQKEGLLEIIERATKANAEERKTLAMMGELKMKFYVRHKDGNISQEGGILPLRSIVETLASPSDEIIEALKQTDEPVKISDSPIEINLPDPTLTFKA